MATAADSAARGGGGGGGMPGPLLQHNSARPPQHAVAAGALVAIGGLAVATGAHKVAEEARQVAWVRQGLVAVA